MGGTHILRSTVRKVRKYKKFRLLVLLPVLLTCTQLDQTKLDTATMERETAVMKQASFSSVTMRSMKVEVPEDEEVTLHLYRNALTRKYVLEYFENLTGSKEVRDAIIIWANTYNIPLDLAFALSWVESRFIVHARSENTSSVDRGLFQLNSKSFPEVKEHEFYDPQLNARLGLSYLSKCIERGENEIVGLAMYNAGPSRVARGMTPHMTLEYISKIMRKREEILDGLFTSMESYVVVVSGGKSLI